MRDGLGLMLRLNLFLLDRINPAMRGAGMDFQDFFVCVFNFLTKLKTPNSLREGGKSA